jgi:hypothetical protein
MSAELARTLRLMMAIALGASAGCSSEDRGAYLASWQHVDLPGFSLMLPPGEVGSSSKSPTDGIHKLNLSRSMVDHLRSDVARYGAVSVTWSSTVYTRADWTRDFLPVFTGTIGDAAAPDSKVMVEEQIDATRWFAIAGSARLPIALGIVTCGELFQVSITYAHYHDVARQLEDIRKIVSSVRCKVTAQNLERPVAAAMLPDKFGTLDSPGMQMFQSLDGEVMVLNFTSGDLNDAEEKAYLSVMRRMMAMALEADADDLKLRKVWIPGSGASQQRSLLEIRDPVGSTMYVGATTCSGMGSTLMSVWNAPKMTDALAIERLGQVGCPGGESTPLRKFAGILEEACATGDQVACEMKKAQSP